MVGGYWLSKMPKWLAIGNASLKIDFSSIYLVILSNIIVIHHQTSSEQIAIKFMYWNNARLQDICKLFEVETLIKMLMQNLK